MTKPHGTGPDGQPVDLVGKPLKPAPAPSAVIFKTGAAPMAKANANGTYTLGEGRNLTRFKVRKGAVLPDGATFTPAEPVSDEQAEVKEAERARKDTADTRALKSAPENRSK